MSIQIAIKSLQTKIPLTVKVLTRLIKTVLRLENVRRADLSVVFVTDRRIRHLHKKFLDEDSVTDVLTFDLGPGFKKGGPIVGEIVISVETAVRQARIYGATPRREMVLYVIHGILHLLGYDDHAPKDIEAMRKKEARLMACLKL